ARRRRRAGLGRDRRHLRRAQNLQGERMSESTNPFRLDGEVALITGGGSGLGFGIAQCFVEAGARVILLGRRREVLEEAVGRLGSGASLVVADITADADTLAAALQNVGPVSILVNNAGNHLKKPAVDTSDAEFLAVINTHVLSAFRLTRLIAP